MHRSLKQCCVAAECRGRLTPDPPGAAGDPVATAGTVEVPDLLLVASVLIGLTPASSRSNHCASLRLKPHAPVERSDAYVVSFQSGHCGGVPGLLQTPALPEAFCASIKDFVQKTRSSLPRKSQGEDKVYYHVKGHRQLIGFQPYCGGQTDHIGELPQDVCGTSMDDALESIW